MVRSAGETRSQQRVRCSVCRGPGCIVSLRSRRKPGHSTVYLGGHLRNGRQLCNCSSHGVVDELRVAARVLSSPAGTDGTVGVPVNPGLFSGAKPATRWMTGAPGALYWRIMMRLPQLAYRQRPYVTCRLSRGMPFRLRAGTG